MKNKLKHKKDMKIKEKAEKSLRSLVKNDENKNKSFEEAIEKVWNPEI